MIDLHCHVLPGIDDGPATIQESLALAGAAFAAGSHTLVATPHVSWRYANDAETIARLVSELSVGLQVEWTAAAEGSIEQPGERALAAAPQIRAGAEIALTRAMEIEPDQLARLGLGGGSCLLIEPPLAPVATGLDRIVSDLQRKGHRVLLAHPERCPAFHRDPRLLESLVGAGALTSITAGAFVGRFGGAVRRFAQGLLEAEMVHNVASDFHGDRGRPPGMADELRRARLTPLAEWLTCQVPAAILDDREIPSRPSVTVPARRDRAWQLFRRA